MSMCVRVHARVRVCVCVCVCGCVSVCAVSLTVTDRSQQTVSINHKCDYQSRKNAGTLRPIFFPLNPEQTNKQWRQRPFLQRSLLAVRRALTQVFPSAQQRTQS